LPIDTFSWKIKKSVNFLSNKKPGKVYVICWPGPWPFDLRDPVTSTTPFTDSGSAATNRYRVLTAYNITALVFSHCAVSRDPWVREGSEITCVWILRP